MADDHPLYLEAIRLELLKAFNDAEVVCVSSAAAGLARLKETCPFDLVLADYSMPGMNGPASVTELVGTAAPAPVVIISGVAVPAEVEACVRAGVRGFMPKTMAGELFSSALKIVAGGGSYIPVEVVSARTAAEPEGSRNEDFTDREFDILRMVVEGLSNKEIARALNCQEVTIKVNLTRIFSKLGTKNRTQAAMMAVNRNLFQHSAGIGGDHAGSAAGKRG